MILRQIQIKKYFRYYKFDQPKNMFTILHKISKNILNN